jgi:hypothetical protein
MLPRPIVVDVRDKPPALFRRNAVVDMREAVETYPMEPRPVTVDVRFCVVRFPAP